MRQKKWKNCPACGATNSMHFKKNEWHVFHSKKYPSIKIGPLSWYVCQKCREGIYTIQSINSIESRLKEHQARHDADTTPVGEVMPVSEASRKLHITRQAVQNLMKAGKLEYVFLGRMRLPKKNAVSSYHSAKTSLCI